MGVTRTWLGAFRANSSETNLDRYLVSVPGFKPLKTGVEAVSLASATIRTIVTKPRAIAGETVVRTAEIFRKATLPMMYAATMYVLAFASVLVGQLVYQLGAPDRLSPGIYAGLLREIGTWLTFMILVAISASATAGDLGARRVRDEIDALEVLGVDKVATLIAPRVLAITIGGVVLGLMMVLITMFFTVFANAITLKEPVWTQITAVGQIMNQYDLVASLLKHTLLGFFVGIVACQKGLSAQGSSADVGRAVAETVVVTYFGIWLFNTIYNTGYFTLFPDLLGIKG